VINTAITYKFALKDSSMTILLTSLLNIRRIQNWVVLVNSTFYFSKPWHYGWEPFPIL